MDNLLGTVLRVYEIEEYLEKMHFVWRISLFVITLISYKAKQKHKIVSMAYEGPNVVQLTSTSLKSSTHRDCFIK